MEIMISQKGQKMKRPDKKGSQDATAPLGLLSRGEQAEIVEMKGQHDQGTGRSKDQWCHMEDRGLRAGTLVEILNNEGLSPVLLKVGESRIALGRGMAMKIMVRRKDQ
jgi:ferrous iron transport protein A